jgi:iron complex outermembrane receptor protein
MSADEALCLLLDDLGLVYSMGADRAVIVQRAGGPTVPAHEDPENVSRLRSGAEPALQVIVTGTRRGDRSAADSLVPLAVVSGSDLSRMGFADTAQAFSKQLPNFNYSQPSLTDATDIVRPAALRGLQPDEMLVLVQGKRRHSSALLNINTTLGRGTAAVDMSMLPVAAIERVEVLSDDAAAQYGSDAIAGVVNIILKRQRKGGDVSVTYGENYTTVRGVPTATGILTQPDGEPVITSDGVYALRYGGDRRAHDGQTVTISGNVGLPLGPEGYIDLAAQGRDQAPTNRAGYDPNEQYPPTDDGLVDSREFTFNRLSQRFGEPRIEDAQAVVNAGVPFADGVAEWYAFGTYGVRYGLTAGFYRSADTLALTEATQYPDGFLPNIKADVHDDALVTGVRGLWKGWNFDLSGNYGRDAIDTATKNSDLVAARPTVFQDGGTRYEGDLVNLDLQRDLRLAALAKPLSVAWGLEYRAERFTIRRGENQGGLLIGTFHGPRGVNSPVLPGFEPGTTSDQRRHSSSAYFDVEQDLATRWTLAGAVRAERYADFGSTLNYKAAARVVLAHGLALHAAVSTGFKAPSLQQQFFSTISTDDVSGQLIDVGTFAATSDVARELGAKDLRPERSHNLSAGVVFDGVDGLDTSLDGYQITIRDRIVLTDNLGVDGTPDQNDAVQSVLYAAGYPSVSGARFFINGVDTITRGVDAAARYRLGGLRLSAGFNYTQTHITRYLDNPGVLDQELTLIGHMGSELLTRGQPGSRLNLGADWSWSELAVSVNANRYGSVVSPATDPGNDLVIQPAWVADVELRYSPADWQFALGAQNLFDKYPTVQPTGARPPSLGGYYDVNNYVVPFSVLSPFGFSGRYLYGRMSFRF